MIKQRWSRPEDFRIFQVNMVKKIVNKRANLYRLAPRRTFDGGDQAQIEAIYKAANVDVVLKKASRMVKLHKTAALQVGWKQDTLALSVVTPNILDAVYSDPEDPSRMIITHRGVKDTDTQYSDWSATGYSRRNYQGHPIALTGNKGNENPYSLLPFVPLFDNLPDDQFFLPGGDDLLEAQEAVNVALSNLWRSVELQAHGQAWATGVNAGEALQTGPDRAITLPEGATFDYAAPNSPIEDILQAIEFVMRQTASSNDLSSDVFDLDRRSESGAAKHIEQIDLHEARQDDISLWRTYEKRLFEVIKAVANTHQPGSIPADTTVTVDFAELQEFQAESERLSNARTKQELGMWSPVDVLRSENPDGYPTRESAYQELVRRKEESDNLLIQL
ncbi:MAG: hypothetical protein AAGI11_06415 [Pseudomonadota bacterium]